MVLFNRVPTTVIIAASFSALAASHQHAKKNEFIALGQRPRQYAVDSGSSKDDDDE